MILTRLFNLTLRYGYVPNEFGLGLTIPIPKADCKSNSSSVNDYRGITISPVISKIFELCLQMRFSKYLFSSSNQFGFKQGVGCNHAIYLVRNTIEHFTKNDSTVNLCTLDLSKAFDKVNIYALFSKLMSRNIPVNFVNLLYSWYDKIYSCVKWSTYVSCFRRLTAGVRQGGVLSPTLFALYVDDILIKLSNSKLGCHIKRICVNSFMYADDLLLIANSVSDLQKLVNICVEEFELLDLSLNASKSSSLRIGPRNKFKCASISAGVNNIAWCDNIRYLGIFISSGKQFKCDFDIARSKFYRSFNSIYSKIGHSNSPSVILSLLSANCLPSLVYGIEAISVCSSEMQRLNLAYTRGR